MDRYGLVQSMSSTGSCYDNAVMESFFHTLKTELLYFEKYQTRQEARRSVFEYIEIFYNRIRRHSSLNYCSPAEFEERGCATYIMFDSVLATRHHQQKNLYTNVVAHGDVTTGAVNAPLGSIEANIIPLVQD